MAGNGQKMDGNSIIVFCTINNNNYNNNIKIKLLTW